MIVCVAEDRKGFLPSIKLLILSLAEHCPNLELYLIFPPADAEFMAWLSQYRQVTLRTEPLPTAYGVNVKPQAMLHLLDSGFDDVLWIDSDIIAAGKLPRWLTELDEGAVVVTEEALWTPYGDPDALRARMWGFEVGRVLPFALNSGIVRMTGAHRALLRKWRTLLESDEYRAAQRQDWHSRPLHMISDQDVLTALLASKEFADIPLRILHRGNDIVQYFGPYGYTLRERLMHAIGRKPAFIHSQGPKPWLVPWLVSGKRPGWRGAKTYLYDLYLELSPYTLTARKYRSELSEPCPWMGARSASAFALRALGLWYAPLVGLPVAALADIYRLSKWLSAPSSRGSSSRRLQRRRHLRPRPKGEIARRLRCDEIRNPRQGARQAEWRLAKVDEAEAARLDVRIALRKLVSGRQDMGDVRSREIAQHRGDILIGQVKKHVAAEPQIGFRKRILDDIDLAK